MEAYIFIAITLAILMLKAEIKSLSSFGIFILGLMFILFVGLRFELGYDWLVYEKYFNYGVNSIDQVDYEYSQTILQTEFGFYLFCAILKSFGGTFETLIFVLGAFNVCILFWIVNKIDKRALPFALFVYTCVALVPIQFNILRTATASSFVFLSLGALLDGRRFPKWLWYCVALSFHFSTIMFAPILLFENFRVTMKSSAVGVLLALVSLIFMTNGVGLSVIAGAGLLPGFVENKLQFYADLLNQGFTSGLSPLAAVLIAIHSGILIVLLKSKQDRINIIAVKLVLLLLMAHVAAMHFPTIWNRVMPVTLPFELAAIWRCSSFQSTGPRFRFFILGGTAPIIAGLFLFQLSRPEYKPYVPYHSLLQVWLFNDIGDGRQKALDAITRYDISNSIRNSD